MNIEHMRRIDRVFGWPICIILGLWTSRHDETRGRPERMLIIKLSEQGATVVAEPAIRRALEIVGREGLFLVVFETNRDIADALDLLHPANILTIRSDSMATILRDTQRVIRFCRKVRVDTVVDFEGFSRFSSIIAALSGAGRRVGLWAPRGLAPSRGRILNRRVPDNPHLHASQTFLMLMEASIQQSDSYPRAPAIDETRRAIPTLAPPSSSEAAKVRRLARVGRSQRFVVLNPNTGDLIPLRRWPSERYVSLGQGLLRANPDMTLVLTGTSAERAGNEGIRGAIGMGDRVSNVAGATTMRDLLVLLAEASLVITNDSGPSHFAALTATPTITLFGPESPSVFGPLSHNSYPIWSALPCSPCVSAANQRQSRCFDNVCMQTISVADVESLAASLLADERVSPDRERRASNNELVIE